MKPFKLLIILTFLLLPFGFLTFQAYSAAENPCLTCHVDLKEPAKSVHAPLSMGCETCHMTVQGKEHPQQKDSIKLTQDMPKLCYGCHDESKFKGQVVHSPVALGMCRGCHNPHNSKFSKLLISDSPDLCYICHDKTRFTKKNVHLAISSVGCSFCHSVHVSNSPFLLPKPIKDVCISCHVAKAKGPHVVAIPGKNHPLSGVIDPSTQKWIKVPDPKNPKRQIEIPDPNVLGKEMSCASCHDPHSSNYKTLLTAERICLKCHKY